MNSRSDNPKSTQDAVPEPLVALDALRRHPGLAELAAELTWRSCATETSAGFVAQGLPLVTAAVNGEFAAVAVFDAGRWRVVADFGARQSLPSDLMGEALDREGAVSSAGWFAAPLAAHAASNEL